MASVKSHERLTVGTVTVRRKPALTYPSPSQNTAILHPEKYLVTSPATQSVTASPPGPPLPPSPPSPFSEPSPSSPSTHKPSRHHMITTLLPLYHPFGPLALSLPDLDPTAFGLPAPVAVLDDPTRRSSNRQRRPAVKVRDMDEPAPAQPAAFVAVTSSVETEAREKNFPRRRRGGGPGGKRKRREAEDGDATYPAKRPRNPRSIGAVSGVSGIRGFGREEGSPALSNAHSRASPAVEAGRSELAEEKKPERRTTRSRRAIVRRDSTASEDTSTSGSHSGSAANTVVARVASSGESMEADEPGAKDGSNEASGGGDEAENGEADNTVPEQQENQL